MILNDVQQQMGREFEFRADIIVAVIHMSCKEWNMMEKLIVYSLGDFWFNGEYVYRLLKFQIDIETDWWKCLLYRRFRQDIQRSILM